MEMHQRLGETFMVGTDHVDVVTHRVTAPDSSSFELSLEAMHLLVELADRAGDMLTIDFLLDEIWGSTRESLELDRKEIAHRFGDTDSANPRYIEATNQGYRLLQAVQRGPVQLNARHSKLLLLELNRRKVFRVAAWYCVVAFVLLQLSDATFDALRLPGEAVPILLTLLVVGFPIAVLLGWFLELNSQGITRDAQSGWFRRMGRRWEFVAVVSLFVVSSAFAVMIARSVDWPVLESETISVAVLRFQNLTGDDSQDHIALGMTEELTLELALLDEYEVASVTSAIRFPDGETDLVTIALELGVEYVIEGSLLAGHGSPHINVQVIDGRTNRHRWAERFQLDDMVSIGATVASAIADELDISVDVPPSRGGPTGPAKDVAYRHYLIARSLLRDAGDLESLEQARDSIDRALDQDPTFGDAVGLGCRAWFDIHALSRDAAHAIEAQRVCTRAVELGSDNLDVKSMLGQLRIAAGDYDAAIDDLRDVLESRPNDQSIQTALAQAYARLGVAHFNADRWDQARKVWDEGFNIAPSARLYYHIGRLYYFNREYKNAARFLEAGAEKFPADDCLWGQLALTYDAMAKDSHEEFQHAARLSRAAKDDAGSARRGAYLAALLDSSEAMLIARAAVSTAMDSESLYWHAMAWARMDNDPLARDAVRRTLDAGFPLKALLQDPELGPFARIVVDEGKQ